MSILNSLLPGRVPEDSTSLVLLESWQEIILRALSFIGFLTGIALFVTSLILRGDLLREAANALLLLGSASVFFGKRVQYHVRAVIFTFMVFVLTQILFILYGWSGQTLFSWIVLSLITAALLNGTLGLTVIGINLLSLLLWTGLAAINRISHVIVITQQNLFLDTVIVFFTGLAVTYVIFALKSILFAQRQSLVKAQIESQEAIEGANNQVQNLEQQLSQVNTAAELSRSISSSLDTNQLIQMAADGIQSAFGLYYVGVFMIDPAHEYAVLRYGTGEEGKRMTARRHRLAVGGYSMIGWATQNQQPRVALDIGEEAVHFDNPDLPETRSELALPIVGAGRIMGALSIQSSKPNAFSGNDVQLLHDIADALGMALTNASAYEKTQRALDDIRQMNRAFVQQAWEEEISQTGELKFQYENPMAPAAPSELSAIKVPLILREEVIGYFNVEVDPEGLQEDQREFLEAISAQTTTALENARLIMETQRSAAKEQKLNQLSEQFSRALTIEDILKTAVTEFGKLPSVSEASISLIPPEEIETSNPNSLDEEVIS